MTRCSNTKLWLSLAGPAAFSFAVTVPVAAEPMRRSTPLDRLEPNESTADDGQLDEAEPDGAPTIE